ncbi:translation initiation factor Sui1 [Thermodesulfobacteriota bacterium]
MEDSRLVYSTESGRICPSCGKPASTCICKTKKVNKTQSAYPNDGIVRIRREVKGRKGKTVTAIFGVPLDDKELQQLAKTLKRRCGTGGSVKDGIIIIQGDHRKTLLDEIKKQGYTAKLAGG